MKSTEEIQGKIQLRPIRIIPVDFGYRIDLKKRNAICDTLKAAGFDFAEDIRLFGEDAILSVNCLPNLTMYLFADGVGVFSYEDDIVKYDNIEDLNAEHVLSERRNAHKDILNHKHSISVKINEITTLLRGVVKEKKRRRTSYLTWESKGLSYVMSFYLLDADRKLIDNKVVQDWLGNMLFTDKHTYFGTVSEFFEQEKHKQIMTNVDVLSDVHVCHSWATMIVLGNLSPEHRQYYVEMEVVLQHIWMFAYITEQNIDMFLAASDNNVSSQQLTDFYDTLIDMTLIVKKYDTIISSTVHERELRIFEALKESSKLEVLKKGIDDKSQILESKLSWAVDQKRLKSDRNTEIFITVLTILEVLGGFGLGFSDFSKPHIWLSVLGCLILFVIYRIKD